MKLQETAPEDFIKGNPGGEDIFAILKGFCIPEFSRKDMFEKLLIEIWFCDIAHI